MNTHEHFVNFTTAKKLKQLGFDWDCYIYYSEIDAPVSEAIVDEKTSKVYGLFVVDICGNPHKEDFLVPTYEVVQRWLRELHYMDINIIRFSYEGEPCYKTSIWIDFEGKSRHKSKESYINVGLFDSYEYAIEETVNRCLDILLKIKAIYGQGSMKG